MISSQGLSWSQQHQHRHLVMEREQTIEAEYGDDVNSVVDDGWENIEDSSLLSHHYTSSAPSSLEWSPSRHQHYWAEDNLLKDVSFVLWDAVAGVPIDAIDVSKGEIDLCFHESNARFSIEARVNLYPLMVLFELYDTKDGRKITERTERHYPFLFGGYVPEPHKIHPVEALSMPGTYTLKATLFPSGVVEEVNFQVGYYSCDPLHAMPTAPTHAPSNISSQIPTTLQSRAEFTDGFIFPTTLQTVVPSGADPTVDPTAGPTSLPTSVPTADPTAYIWPTTASAEPSALEIMAQTIRINAGGGAYGNKADDIFWSEDQYFMDSSLTYHDGEDTEPQFCRTNRNGPLVRYKIPVNRGETFNLYLHFCEISGIHENERVFNITVNGELQFVNVDIMVEAGARATPLTKHIYVEDVKDGYINVELKALRGDAMISGIELLEEIPHLAHSVPGGPYVGVVRDGGTWGPAEVDGSNSHTHARNKALRNYRWYWDGRKIGQGPIATLSLPVGIHNVELRVRDSGMNHDSVRTKVTIKEYGFPAIDSLFPQLGRVADLNDTLTISGVGFNFSSHETVVHFGHIMLSGPEEVVVMDQRRIFLPMVPDARTTTGPVKVSVETPIGRSESVDYYVYEKQRFEFQSGVIHTPLQPSVLAFGPDHKLYVGNTIGHVYKYTLDDHYNLIGEPIVSTAVANIAFPDDFRSILGIAFDPNDRGSNPTVYVSHSILFHSGLESWSVRATNGKVSALHGEFLDGITHIVEGLPVSDYDHAVNGLEFGDDSELYINVGSNTNAGVPGRMSLSGVLKDNYFSGATLVAHLGRQDYDGLITYNQGGDQTGGFDVEMFVAGQRNPYDLVLHSSGNLYSTDNGPNDGFGRRSTGCYSSTRDPEEDDELNLLTFGGYYGHPNRKRGTSNEDPRQCIWRSMSESSDDVYTSPILTLPSSTTGVIEFQSSHFDGELHHHLIMGKYKGGLYLARLADNDDDNNHDSRHREAHELIELMPTDGGLSVAQGPDGTLFVAQYELNAVVYHSPIDPPPTSDDKIILKSVFPRRGPQSGGSVLTLYGENFHGANNGNNVSGGIRSGVDVMVGDNQCTNVVVSGDGRKLTCIVPPLSGAGGIATNVVVSSSGWTSNLSRAYRYTR